MIRRQTFPELYDRNKLMVGRFGGFVLDDGTWSPQGHLKCNHTVMILMPWNALHGIENKSIEKQLTKRTRASLEENSAQVDLRYALGLLNSDQARLFLEGVTRSAITGESQPDDLREIPIPIPSHETASAIAEGTDTAIQAQRDLLPFRQEGWSIEFGSIKPSGTVPKDISKKPLAVARAAWQLVIHKPSAKTGDLIRVGGDVFRAKQKVMSTSESHGKALDWLVHQLNTLPQGTTLEGAEHDGILVPATPDDGVLAFEKLTQQVNEVKSLLEIVRGAKTHISERLDELFETVSHPPMY